MILSFIYDNLGLFIGLTVAVVVFVGSLIRWLLKDEHKTDITKDGKKLNVVSPLETLDDGEADNRFASDILTDGRKVISRARGARIRTALERFQNKSDELRRSPGLHSRHTVNHKVESDSSCTASVSKICDAQLKVAHSGEQLTSTPFYANMRQSLIGKVRLPYFSSDQKISELSKDKVHLDGNEFDYEHRNIDESLGFSPIKNEPLTENKSLEETGNQTCIIHSSVSGNSDDVNNMLRYASSNGQNSNDSSSAKLNVGKLQNDILELLEQLEIEKKQRTRAEDWANFLTIELEAHIHARTSAENRYFKLRRKLMNFERRRKRENQNVAEHNSDELDGVSLDHNSNLTDNQLPIREDIITITKAQHEECGQYRSQDNTDSDGHPHGNATVNDAERSCDVNSCSGDNSTSSDTAGNDKIVTSKRHDNDETDLLLKSPSEQGATPSVKEAQHGKEKANCSYDDSTDGEDLGLDSCINDDNVLKNAKLFDNLSEARANWEEEFSKKCGSDVKTKDPVNTIHPDRDKNLNEKEAFWNELGAYKIHVESPADKVSPQDGNDKDKSLTESLEKPLNLKAQTEMWEEKLNGGSSNHLEEPRSRSGSKCALENESLEHIQKTRMLWEEMAASSCSLNVQGSTPRRLSIESDSGQSATDLPTKPSRSSPSQPTTTLEHEPELIMSSGLNSALVELRISDDGETAENVLTASIRNVDMTRQMWENRMVTPTPPENDEEPTTEADNSALSEPSSEFQELKSQWEHKTVDDSSD